MRRVLAAQLTRELELAPQGNPMSLAMPLQQTSPRPRPNALLDNTKVPAGEVGPALPPPTDPA